MTTRADILTLNPDHLVMMDGSATDEGVGPSAPKALVTQGTSSDFLGPPCCRDVTNSWQPISDNARLEMEDTNEINGSAQTQRTMCGWIKTPAGFDAISSSICFYKEGGATSNFAIVAFPGGGVLIQVLDSGDFQIQHFPDATLQANRSYYFSFRFDGNGGTNRFDAFIDGIKSVISNPDPPAPGTPDMDPHTGDISWGDPDSILNIGGASQTFSTLENCGYNAWFSTRTVESDATIREFLFERQAPPDVTISADTVANMQAALNAYSNTVRPNAALAIAIEQATDATDFALTASNIEFDPRCSIEFQFTGTGNTLALSQAGTTNLDSTKASAPFGGSIIVSPPSFTFSAPNLTSAVFNRVRTRLSLVPGGPTQLNDDNSVASGGLGFLPSDVNLTSNTINVTGTAGKVSAASIIRIHGSDLPAPLDPTGIYYPSATYDGSDNISLSTTPGGTAVNLTDVGTVPATPNMFMGIWTELDNSLITSGAYTVDLGITAAAAGVALANNDVLTLQAIHHDAPGTGGTAVISEYLEQSFQYAGASITTLETLRQATLTMQLLQELGLDGSQVTGYSFDAENPAKIQIDTNKTTISTLELLAFYYHIQSTEAGMRFARGNVIVENANRIKLLGEITFDASVPSVMSGPYMFSPNGSWQAPESATITQLVEDTRAVIITEEKPVDLPEEVLQAINSIVYGVGHLIANGGVLTQAQSDQLETLYNATEDGTGLTVFSTASLANAPSGGGGGSVTQQFIRDALTLAPTAGTPAADSIDAQLAGIPTVTEFEARTLLAADYFDPAADIVARVTLTDTTTDLTNLPTIPANWLTSAGIDPSAITAFQTGLSTLVNDTAILAAIGAIPTNPLLTTDTRLNNLDATISSRLEDTAYTAPLDATATTAAATAALTAYRPPTRAELTADIASIISQGNTAWITATGFSTFDPGATAVTITQAFPANFASLAISSTGGVTADNMRGTDNANTNFTPLDREFQIVRNLVAAGL